MARILFVDDAESVRDAFGSLLRSHGHEVILASDGADAIKLIREGESYDLIISDLDMPEVNGLDFLKLMKGNPDTAKVPFILHTGNVSPVLADICREAGGIYRLKGERRPLNEDVLRALGK
jgi:CheY-like chemotaxis protein